MKRIISIFLSVAMLMSMVVVSTNAWDEDVASQIETENIVSYTLNQETYKAGDDVLITVEMDEIWGDPDLVGSIPGFAFEGPGAYGMAMLTPSIAFPTDVFEVTKSIRDYAGSSDIYGLGKDPNGDKWGNTITKTTTEDANAFGFMTALVEAKDIYTYEYEDEETGDFLEEKIFGLFQGSGKVVQFRMVVKDDAVPGTYKIPLGSFQRADGAADSEYEFFGNYFKANGFVDGAANAYGERPITFVSATDEYVDNDPSVGAYITIVVEGDVNPAAVAVDELIAAIGTVTLDSEADIAAARAAYDALDDAAKAAVTGLATLEAAEATLEALKADAKAQADAAMVDALIAAIGEVTLDSEADIAVARAAYDELDDVAKAYVTGLETLEIAEAMFDALKDAAEAEAALKAAAAEVDELIAAIGEVTLDSEADIAVARAAYDELDDAAKAYVTGLETLEIAEATLDALKDAAEAEAALKAAAAEVDALIAAIGDVTLDSEDAITAARTAYDALDDAAKAYVTELATLESAEATLAQLKADADAEAAAKAAAAEVDALIDAIGEVTLDSGDAIFAARVAYGALDDAAKAYVTKLAILGAAEVTYNALTAEVDAAAKAAAEVDALIDAIGEVTLDSEDAIVAARTAYDALNDVAKVYVSKLVILEAAEATLAQLKADADAEAALKAAAADIDALIAAIGEVTLDSEDAIVAARTAYDAADDAVKAYVTELATLEAAEAALAQLKADAEAEAAAKAAAADIDALIAAIGEVTLDSEDAIVAARTAYDAADDAVKAYVTELATLEAAEAALAQLKADAEAEAALKAAAADIDALIAAIGEVTLDSEAAIVAARAAVDAASEDVLAYVEGIDVLNAAEAELELLKKAADRDFIFDVIDGVIAPVVPQNVVAIGSFTSIDVSWDAVDGATKYWVLVDGVVVAVTTDTSYTLTGYDPADYEIAVRVALNAPYGTSYIAGTSDAVVATVTGYAAAIEFAVDGDNFTASWSFADESVIEKAWVLITTEDGTTFVFRVDDSLSMSYAKAYKFGGQDITVAVRTLVDGIVYHYDA